MVSWSDLFGKQTKWNSHLMARRVASCLPDIALCRDGTLNSFCAVLLLALAGVG